MMTARSGSLAVMAGLIVLFEQVKTEVAVDFAPDGMGMVGVVLGVVVFDEEG
jgi:hypothetical protein